jgi:hypothetical protein
VDAITLDALLAETAPVIVGRHLSRPRLVAADAVALEVSGLRERWLWLDAGRGTAGAYLLSRELARRLASPSSSTASHRARQALLLLRKHVDGVRLSSLERVPGDRVLVARAGRATLVLRPGGSAPALTLAVDDAPLATLGEGREAWPPPAPAPEREWSLIDPAAFEAAVAAGRAEGRSPARAVLAACPGLGPLLARELDGTAGGLATLRERLAEPRPVVLAPGPRESWHDAGLAAESPLLSPVRLSRPGLVPLAAASWAEAGALFLEGRRRGALFEAERKAALERARRAVRRLEQLERNLASDLRGLADPTALRRQAEALLAFGHALEPGAESVELPDPREPETRRVIALDPRLSGRANADRLFDKARRAERAAREVELRLKETRSALAAARAREAQAEEARDASALPGREERRAQDPAAAGPAGPRHYLTGRGLSILVGRGARENHHLTFRVARPEDLWLHARDVPGAHVVLRDPEGRAGAEDLHEAAEVAAFFSEARDSALVDVHVTRRKHVRPGRGGPGRVFVSHSDTLRVPPRDPEGRLRRR